MVGKDKVKWGQTLMTRPEVEITEIQIKIQKETQKYLARKRPSETRFGETLRLGANGLFF